MKTKAQQITQLVLALLVAYSAIVTPFLSHIVIRQKLQIRDLSQKIDHSLYLSEGNKLLIANRLDENEEILDRLDEIQCPSKSENQNGLQ